MKELEFIGNRIRIARTMAGLSQAELAEKAGLSNLSIVRYEKGERSIEALHLLCIAKATGVTTDWLCGFDVKKTIKQSEIINVENTLALFNQKQMKFYYKQIELTAKNILENFRYHIEIQL